jgi:hypothetical protein
LYESEKNKFLKTILDSFLSHDADIMDIDFKIIDLIKDEPIEYDILELKDFSILSEIKDLALLKKPPFE